MLKQSCASDLIVLYVELVDSDSFYLKLDNFSVTKTRCF